jgi:hypothetical protein
VRFGVQRGGQTLRLAVRARRYATASFPAAQASARPSAEPSTLPLVPRDTLATKRLVFTVTKVEPPEARPDTARRAGAPSREAQAPLRFSGSFGNSDITVRGPANTVVLIADRECWMEVRTGDAVVRLQLRDGCGKSPLERR